MKDVVAVHEADAVVTDEFLADEERLCQSVGGGLFGVGKVHAVVTAIAEQALETRQVLRSGDDENVADSGKHENRDGIIDHRLVEDGN